MEKNKLHTKIQLTKAAETINDRLNRAVKDNDREAMSAFRIALALIGRAISSYESAQVGICHRCGKPVTDNHDQAGGCGGVFDHSPRVL